MIGPASADGAFEEDPAPPLAQGVECWADLALGPAMLPLPKEGNDDADAAPLAPGTNRPLTPTVALGPALLDNP